MGETAPRRNLCPSSLPHSLGISLGISLKGSISDLLTKKMLFPSKKGFGILKLTRNSEAHNKLEKIIGLPFRGAKTFLRGNDIFQGSWKQSADSESAWTVIRRVQPCWQPRNSTRHSTETQAGMRLTGDQVPAGRLAKIWRKMKPVSRHC